MAGATRLNVTNLLLWLGAGALVVVFHRPYATARELARVELDAIVIVRALAAAGVAEGTALTDPKARDGLGDRVRAHCDAAGLARQAWPQTSEDADAGTVRLQNDHYLFLLATTPAPVGAAEAGAAAVHIEAWAWPREVGGEGRAAFYVSDGETFFARNLTAHYRGTARPPTPGGARPRAHEDNRVEYWGIDGQRWRPLP